MRQAGGHAYSESMVRVALVGLIMGCCVGAVWGVALPTTFVLSKPVFWVLAVVFVLLVLSAPILLYQSNNYFLGYLGERTVSDELDKAMAKPQWRIFHGFDTGFGDIDHIIVCPKGVFCVETKTLRKHPDKAEKIIFNDGALWRNGVKRKRLDNPDPIKQAKGNADRLREYLDIERVDSFVAFPGWWVEPPARGHDDKYVTPCNPETIGGKLSQKTDTLSDEQIKKICNALEEKNRSELTDAP